MLYAQFTRLVRTTFLVVLLMVLVPVACAPDALTGGAASTEPMLIALRNSSGRNLDSMTVQESTRSLSEPMRLGSIAPAMKGQTYTFMRPENPPRLPKEVMVVFAHRQVGTQQVSVRLREALRNFQGLPNEALIFDIQSSGQVRVYLDVVAR